MLTRRAVPLVVLLALFCSAALAPGAMAKTPRLAFYRPCSGILDYEDFADNLEEVVPPRFIADTAFTECRYGSDSEGPGGDTQQFTHGELGVECLAISLKILAAAGTPPEGDCYRLCSLDALFITGPLAKKLLPKLEKGTRRRTWPTGYTRKKLAHVGNDAEYGFLGGKGFGYLQVLNASVELNTDELSDLPGLLKEAASVL